MQHPQSSTHKLRHILIEHNLEIITHHTFSTKAISGMSKKKWLKVMCLKLVVYIRLFSQPEGRSTTSLKRKTQRKY